MAHFILAATPTRTTIENIIHIYNIIFTIDISINIRQRNIYIYSIISIIFIINISLLQTNCKHCLHSSTMYKIFIVYGFFYTS